MVDDDGTTKARPLPWDLMNVTAHQAGEAEGWWLSTRDDGLFEVQKFAEDPAARFANDGEAYRHVFTCAEAGSVLQREALLRHGKYWFRDHRIWKPKHPA
jgi:hypothetical protein